MDPPGALRFIIVFPPQEYSQPFADKGIELAKSLEHRPCRLVIIVPTPFYRIGVYLHISQSLSHNRTLPAITVRPKSYEAAPFALCYGLRFWQAPLAG